ncbi:MAG: hypothetical protein GX676_02015 [Bacilli bacterium]|nr:hypothetical protein [Bacilli bacterium]
MHYPAHLHNHDSRFLPFLAGIAITAPLWFRRCCPPFFGYPFPTPFPYPYPLPTPYSSPYTFNTYSAVVGSPYSYYYGRPFVY